MKDKTEEWLFNKAKKLDPSVALQDLYTSKFSFGGREVMDMLEEYHLEQSSISGVMCQREQLIAFAKYSLENDLGNVNQSINKDVEDFLVINCT